MYRITTDHHKVHSHFYSNLWFYWFSQLVATKARGHQLCRPSNSSIVFKAVSRRPHFSDALTLPCCWITSILIALARLKGLFITVLNSKLHSLC